MHSYKKESIRLAAAKSSVARAFPFYSENKRHEITRLAFEISQREGASPANVVRTLTKGVKDLAHYQAVKKAFLKRRFPGASAESPHVRAYLPQVYLDKAQVLEIKNTPFSPRFIFYEKGTRTSALYGRFTKRFPRARTIEIESLAAYRKEKKFSLREYNERRDRVFLTNERFDFFKRCPCTKAAQGCGYHVFNLGFGCIFECSYCFLQEYVNAPGILFPANIQRFFAQFYDHGPSRARIGTGEFSDSLMLDDVTQYSQELIDFFRKFPKVIFEFKTKSDNVLGVCAARPARNVVIAWTFSPQSVVTRHESLTASLRERVRAAQTCFRHGYKVGIHFDPVVHYPAWRKDYEELIDTLFCALPARAFAWISIGSLRFMPHTKITIEKRFPGTSLLHGELLPGYDGKLRYPYAQRLAMYDFLLQCVRRHSPSVPVYLCMEPSAMWSHFKKYRLSTGNELSVLR